MSALQYVDNNNFSNAGDGDVVVAAKHNGW
jgi:hypothetical protein